MAIPLNCPHCNGTELVVAETRVRQELKPFGQVVRRRRRCLKCEQRFTTMEVDRQVLVRQLGFAARYRDLLQQVDQDDAA